jgi:hypothetical protein
MINTVFSQIDIKENELLKLDIELLNILLEDKSSKKNIVWATDNYVKHGLQYEPKCEIMVDLITSYNGNIIKPRIEKSKTEQQTRIRYKAEVFTSSWICNKQNNLVDEAWFGEKSPFNEETDNGWKTNPKKISFPPGQGKTWEDYICAKRLEISCGEAPYLTSRYDTVTGEYIPVKNRIGFLDRKLRIVNENTENKENWLKWAYNAVTAVYGFDWQGDNVLIARENILFDIAEYFEDKFNKVLDTRDLIGFAKVISWNIWQMDGLKFVIPDSCCAKEIKEQTLFEEVIVSKTCEGCRTGNNLKHNGIYCVIKDWDTHQNIRFADLVDGRK